MDADAIEIVARLLRETRVAALGSLRDGAPFVSMVAFVAHEDMSCLYLHLSGLAIHTRAIVDDPRVALMVAEPDAPERDPQTLARLSIEARASRLARDSSEATYAGGRYLERFPDAAQTMALGDFAFYRIDPLRARLVAGLGRTFNLTPGQLSQAADRK